MSKAPWLTESVKDQIRAIHLEHSDWKQTKVRKELLKRLSGDSKYEPGWPKLASVKSVLSEMRDREGNLTTEEKNLNEPWSVSIAIKRNMPPDAVPTLLRVQNYVRRTGIQFTIREALWVAYLYKIPALNSFSSDGPVDYQSVILAMIAKLYSMREAVKTVAGLPLDTSDLDEILGAGKIVPLAMQFYREWGTLPYHTQEADVGLIKQDGLIPFFHKKLGLSPDIPLPTFTVSCNSEYEYLLWLNMMLLESQIVGSVTAPKEVQEQFVLSLQKWIKENEPDFKFKLPPPISRYPIILAYESLASEQETEIKQREKELDKSKRELELIKVERQMEVEQTVDKALAFLVENVVEIKRELEEFKLKLQNPQLINREENNERSHRKEE